MPTLHIPIEVYQICLRVGEILSVSLWSQNHFLNALRVCNRIWQQADILFDVRSYAAQNFELLNADSNANLSSSADKMYVLSNHRGRNGIGVCLVNTPTTASGDLLGGYYDPRLRSCLVSFSNLTDQAGVNLAHELGHGLLGLGHGAGSGNLMQTHTPSLVNITLTADQIRIARGNVALLTT